MPCKKLDLFSSKLPLHSWVLNMLLKQNILQKVALCTVSEDKTKLLCLLNPTLTTNPNFNLKLLGKFKWHKEITFSENLFSILATKKAKNYAKPTCGLNKESRSCFRGTQVWEISNQSTQVHLFREGSCWATPRAHRYGEIFGPH